MSDLGPMDYIRQNPDIKELARKLNKIQNDILLMQSQIAANVNAASAGHIAENRPDNEIITGSGKSASSVSSGTDSVPDTGSFSDDDFVIFDEGDDTKLIKMVLAALTTATTRTLTMPDKNLSFAIDTGAEVIDHLEGLSVTIPVTGDWIIYSDGGVLKRALISELEKIIDHGSVGGLADDDHTQYLLADGSRNVTGNMIFEDSVKALFGTDSDGEVYHDDADMYIINNKGKIYIQPVDATKGIILRTGATVKIQDAEDSNLNVFNLNTTSRLLQIAVDLALTDSSKRFAVGAAVQDRIGIINFPVIATANAVGFQNDFDVNVSGNSFGQYNRVEILTTKTSTIHYTIYITNPIGAGAITTNYGMYIEEQTKGGTDFDLFLASDLAEKKTTTAWTATSDVRIKTVLRDYVAGLTEILGIQPRVFRHNGQFGFEDTGEEHVGVVADEIELVLPNTVKTSTHHYKIGDDDDGPIMDEVPLKKFNPHEMFFTMVNAIKELSAKNDALQSRIEALEARK